MNLICHLASSGSCYSVLYKQMYSLPSFGKCNSRYVVLVVSEIGKQIGGDVGELADIPVCCGVVVRYLHLHRYLHINPAAN